MLTGISAAQALHLGLIGDDGQLDAYVDQEHVNGLVSRYRLQPSRDPNVTLRVVPEIGWSWPPARIAPKSAVALDLLDHPEPRARQVGHDVLASLGA
jgi:hypothetical protein